VREVAKRHDIAESLIYSWRTARRQAEKIASEPLTFISYGAVRQFVEQRSRADIVLRKASSTCCEKLVSARATDYGTASARSSTTSHHNNAKTTSVMPDDLLPGDPSLITRVFRLNIPARWPAQARRT